MARLRRNGISIHMEAHGQGPAILLTHGFGATSRMRDEQIEEFTDRYSLIAWDLPGHGQSGAPGRKTTVDSLIEDMAGILDAAEAKRAVLIGLGVGGALTLRFCHHHPSRTRALILIGTMPGLRSEPARTLWNAQVTALAAALERDGLSALKGGTEADPRMHGDAGGLAEAARILLTQRDAGVLPMLAAIDVPVLVLAGGDDKPNLTAADYLARTIPNARKTIIHRAGHAANIHKPDAVNAAITDFLGRLPA